MKGTRAARCRPPRGGAWLRGNMVSANEAGFDLREIAPLSRNILHSCGVKDHGTTGQRTDQEVLVVPTGHRGWLLTLTSPKAPTGHLSYPVGVRDSAKSGLGHTANRHLPYLAASIFVNVGGHNRPLRKAVFRGLLWRRRPHSSPRVGKPPTWRRGPVRRDSNANGNRM